MVLSLGLSTPRQGNTKVMFRVREHFLLLLLNPIDFLCLCPYDLRVALGKEVSCALMRLRKEERLLKEEKEEINKLSCICLLYMKVPYKQSLMLINIQSGRNETINVRTKLLTTRCSIYDKCSCVLRGVVVDRPRNRET